MQMSECSSQLFIYKIREEPSSSSQPLKVSHSITIKSDLSVRVVIHGHELNTTTCDTLLIPEQINTQTLTVLLLEIENLNVCPGHPDKQFVHMVNERNGRLLNSFGETAAYIDKEHSVDCSGERYSETVRTYNCQLLTNKHRCSSCVRYRDTIRSMYHRWLKQQDEPKCVSTHSHVNERWLNTDEMKQKTDQLKSRLRTTERRNVYLEYKIKEDIDKKSIEVDKELNNGLVDIMNEYSDKINQQYEENSFHHLFWNEQVKNVTKSPKLRRWHPMIIRWCLHLKMLSSGAYNVLRRVLVLPCGRTLRDYTHFIQAGVGIQAEVTQQLMTAVNMDDLKDYEKHVSMKIKEGLVYNKNEGKIVGFVDLGEVNNTFASFEQSLAQSTNHAHLPIAKHMLVFMVRGLFMSLKFPYAQYPTADLTADNLFPLAWDVVRHLEATGFKVVSLTADKGSCNPKFFRLHRQAGAAISDVVYKVPNPYSSDGRNIYFISDVPHLIKTVRNAWSNSFGHSHARALWVSISSCREWFKIMCNLRELH